MDTFFNVSELEGKMNKAFKLPVAEDRYEEKLLLDIKEIGWGINGVPPKDGNPGFVFTTGLFYSFGHPEVIIFGINFETSKLILNKIGFKIKSGSSYENDSYYDDIFENYTSYFHDVDLKFYEEHLGQALWLYKNLENSFPCLQLVWPDRAGYMPWDKELNKNYVGLQSLLFNRSLVESI